MSRQVGNFALVIGFIVVAGVAIVGIAKPGSFPRWLTNPWTWWWPVGVVGYALLWVLRGLQAWDFVHCPPETKHVIVGAGEEPCVIVAVGARDRTRGEDWGGYAVDEPALRHLAGVEDETDDPKHAYARFSASELSRYREGWLPDLG